MCDSIEAGDSIFNDYIVYDECSFDFYSGYGDYTVEPGTTKVSSSKQWLFWYDYEYKEIDNIIDLNKYNNDLSFEFYKDAQSYDWAVNFLNTEKKTSHGIPTTDQIVEGTSVYDVAVLKLTYVKDCQTYNAYAVTKPTSTITGSSSDSHTSFLAGFGEYGKYIGVIF